MYDMQPYLTKINEVIARGPFSDNWESLAQYSVPAWYKQAKFGIFVHWGIYSVPAYGSEWYSRNMYQKFSSEYFHHLKTYGAHKDFGYKDFLKDFKAENFDAKEWVNLFLQAGAKYTVFVAEHHDGFQMYESEISEWNVSKKGPCKNTLSELKAACTELGLRFGASSHRAEHWFFMDGGKKFESDIREPLQRGDLYWPSQQGSDSQDLFGEPAPTEEYLQDWLVRTCELVDKYMPEVVYFDWWIQHSAFKPYLLKFAAFYYNLAAERNRGVVINYKHDAFLFGTAVPDVERGQFAEVKPFYWQTDTAIARNSWGYTKGNSYKTAPPIVRTLVDVVSKNGNFLLNVGPRADGTITEEETAVLKNIGDWLKINGEAIYGAEVYRTSGEGPTKIKEGQFAEHANEKFTHRDFRFTVANGCLYATAMSHSKKGKYLIKTFAKKDASRVANFHGIIKDVEVLGCSKKPSWSRDSLGLHLQTEFCTEYPIVFKITLA